MKELKKWIVMIAALFVLTGMMSCEMFAEAEDRPVVMGEWAYYLADGSYSSDDISHIITSSSYSGVYAGSAYTTAEIVSSDNSGWNGDETGEGDYGYYVVKYTTSDYTPESIDKYMVHRWQNFEYSDSAYTMEFCEGSDYPTNTYFDTAEEAIANATSAAGFFGTFNKLERVVF